MTTVPKPHTTYAANRLRSHGHTTPNYSPTKKYRKGSKLDRDLHKDATEYTNLITDNSLHKPITYDFDLEETMLNQYSVKKGLKVFGEKGEQPVVKELTQLHNMKGIEPTSTLTKQKKRAALMHLMYLKEKKIWVVKGWGCDDGRKQRETMDKTEASSLTVAIKYVLLASTIDALEERAVCIMDIPEAYLNSNMDELVHARLEGKMAELLVV